jgi:hypothetical protein
MLNKLEKSPTNKCWGLLIKTGGDLLSRNKAVPSALVGLTSLFGMGRGEPHCYNHPKFLGSCIIQTTLLYFNKKDILKKQI